ncbi:unnamed protein product [Soboliphyme baturini]|uniref:RNA helicase n=1 Tax=Soboliphyme baturini TaxID=241478 RepID=A0A183ITU5_9BILA|nr:unnamed protein product [Soboliphyme baturini]
MTDEQSVLYQFYPIEFETDLNGKKNDWEAVVLLPFIDEELLLKTARAVNSQLSDEEKHRNSPGFLLCFRWGLSDLTKLYRGQDDKPAVICERMSSSQFHIDRSEIVYGLVPGVKVGVYFPGFPTFGHLSFESDIVENDEGNCRNGTAGERVALKVTGCEQEKVESMAKKYLGEVLYVNWPHLKAALCVKICSENRWYEVSAEGEIASRMIWGETAMAFPSQIVVRNLLVDQVSLRYTSLSQMFPCGSTVFVLNPDFYGCEGIVLEHVNKSRVLVSVTLRSEPDLSELRAVDAARQNIGLDLKYNKLKKEIPDYSHRDEYGLWWFSEKVLPLVSEYTHNRMRRFDDLRQWLKSLPTSRLSKLTSGTDYASEDQIQKLEQTIMHSEMKSVQKKLTVHPTFLYRSVLSSDLCSVEPVSSFHLFDRVVNVRNGSLVPLGLRGTIVAVIKRDTGEICKVDVVFDEAFPGAESIRGSKSSGYRVEPSSLINLSFHGGQRKPWQSERAGLHKSRADLGIKSVNQCSAVVQQKSVFNKLNEPQSSVILPAPPAPPPPPRGAYPTRVFTNHAMRNSGRLGGEDLFEKLTRSLQTASLHPEFIDDLRTPYKGLSCSRVMSRPAAFMNQNFPVRPARPCMPFYLPPPARRNVCLSASSRPLFYGGIPVYPEAKVIPVQPHSGAFVPLQVLRNMKVTSPHKSNSSWGKKHETSAGVEIKKDFVSRGGASRQNNVFSKVPVLQGKLDPIEDNWRLRSSRLAARFATDD